MRRSSPVVVVLTAALGLGLSLATGYSIGSQTHAADQRVFTCSMHPQVRNAGAGMCPICRMELVPADAAVGDQGAAIAIDPVMVQNAGVRIQRVARGELADDLRLSGSLAVAQDREQDITLRFSGFLEVLHANRDGMAIRKGDPLFEVYSPDLIVAEERLIAAKRSGEAVPLQAARLKLERWDVPAATMAAVIASGDVPRTIVWPSPVNGLLVERSVVQGGRIDAGMTALRIADLSTVWLEAQVPESQVASVSVGMEATIELQSQPGVTRTGKVSLIAPLVDEHTRTGSLRIELPNPDGKLMPGMYARVRLHVLRKPDAALIPDEAIIETGERRLCWVALGDGRFEPRTLRLGAAGAGGVTEVLDGVAVGEPVVVSGQLLIDADSRLRENMRKFLAKDLLPAGAIAAAPAEPVHDAALQQEVDAVFSAYLEVGKGLALDRDDVTAWQHLGAAVAKIGERPDAAHCPATLALVAVAARPAPDLATRREAFLAISDAVVGLVEQVRPSDACGKEILVVHCSMKPGWWLQTDRAVRNPYYGAEMLACGKIERVLPTATGGVR